MTQEKSITEQTTKALDSSVETLSPNILARLQSARRLALENHPATQAKKSQTSGTRSFEFLSVFTPKAMSAGLSFSLLALLAWPLLNLTNSPQPENSSIATSNSNLGEFILNNNFDDTELEIIEDIEFAYWLSQELEINDDDNTLFNPGRQQHNG